MLLWESWLRHEVPMNMDEDDRVSVSFKTTGGSNQSARVCLSSQAAKASSVSAPRRQILHFPHALGRIGAAFAAH